MTYHSELGQDEQLDRELFNGHRGGVFVDVGAYDGVGFSNTAYFERELGWTGLCFEPHPQRFERLKVNRPNSYCTQAACGSQRGKAKFLMCLANPKHLEAEAKEGAAKVPGSQLEMLSCMEHAAHARRREAHSNWLREYGGEVQEVEVPVVRLGDELARRMILVVDYLTIDAEGSEADVLAGIEWGACRINVIEFEVAYRDTGDDLRETAKLYDLLAAKGMHHHGDLAGGRDRVFVGNNVKWSWSK